MGKSPLAPAVTCRLISALPSFSLCACAPIDQQIRGLTDGMDVQQQSSAVLSLEKSVNPNGRTEAHERISGWLLSAVHERYVIGPDVSMNDPQ